MRVNLHDSHSYIPTYFCRTMKNVKRIAIFASGSGTNAQAIMEHFKDINEVDVALLVCNKPGAGVIERAVSRGVKSVLISKADVESQELLSILKKNQIDWIVLAGYLWLIPGYLVNAFPNRIVNIHPALLPNYGGKGMYGGHVHKAVIANGEKESGITIHFVNAKYDEGQIIFQASCEVQPDDTPQSLAERIHSLEHAHFPVELEKLISA